jgi:hypothetical protein
MSWFDPEWFDPEWFETAVVPAPPHPAPPRSVVCAQVPVSRVRALPRVIRVQVILAERLAP